MDELKSGDKIIVSYGRMESYDGIVSDDWILYSDGEKDHIPVIINQVRSGICKVYKEVEL